jgi:hypothetical protein
MKNLMKLVVLSSLVFSIFSIDGYSYGIENPECSIPDHKEEADIMYAEYPLIIVNGKNIDMGILVSPPVVDENMIIDKQDKGGNVAWKVTSPVPKLK